MTASAPSTCCWTKASRSAGSPAAADRPATAGDFIVAAAAGDVADIAKQTGVDFTALSGAAPTGAYELSQAAHRDVSAIRRRQHGRGLDAADVRAVQRALQDDHGRGDQDRQTRTRSTTSIILPSDSIAAMTGERPPDRRRGGRAAARWRWRSAGRDNTPPEYRSGFGAEGVKALKSFVEKGGTLVTFGAGRGSAIQRFDLPLRNVVAGLPAKEFWSPGSTLRVRFDNQHPLATACRPRAWRSSWPAARSMR